MKLLSVAIFVLVAIAVVHAAPEPEKPRKVSVSLILDQCATILKSLPRAIQRFIVEAISKIGGIKIEAIIKIVEAARNFIGTIDGMVEMTGSMVIQKMRFLLDVILTIVSGVHHKSSR